MTIGKRSIEVDSATAATLELRAADAGVTVAEFLAGLVVSGGTPASLSQEELAELDRQWSAIGAGEPTVPHDDVVRWLDTWGTSGFRPWADG